MDTSVSVTPIAETEVRWGWRFSKVKSRWLKRKRIQMRIASLKKNISQPMICILYMVVASSTFQHSGSSEHEIVGLKGWKRATLPTGHGSSSIPEHRSQGIGTGGAGIDGIWRFVRLNHPSWWNRTSFKWTKFTFPETNTRIWKWMFPKF